MHTVAFDDLFGWSRALTIREASPDTPVAGVVGWFEVSFCAPAEETRRRAVAADGSDEGADEGADEGCVELSVRPAPPAPPAPRHSLSRARPRDGSDDSKMLCTTLMYTGDKTHITHRI